LPDFEKIRQERGRVAEHDFPRWGKSCVPVRSRPNQDPLAKFSQDSYGFYGKIATLAKDTFEKRSAYIKCYKKDK